MKKRKLYVAISLFVLCLGALGYLFMTGKIKIGADTGGLRTPAMVAREATQYLNSFLASVSGTARKVNPSFETEYSTVAAKNYLSDGFYGMILGDISDTKSQTDFEAFSRIRAKNANYINELLTGSQSSEITSSVLSSSVYSQTDYTPSYNTASKVLSQSDFDNVSNSTNDLISAINPSFENPASGGDPAKWTKQVSGPGAVSRDSTTKHSGNYSWKFTNTSASTSTKSGLSDFIEVNPLDKIYFSMWVNASAGANDGSRGFSVNWIAYDNDKSVVKDSSGKSLGGQILSDNYPPASWTRYYESFDIKSIYAGDLVTAKRIKYIKIKLSGLAIRKSGSLWFDDLQLSKVTPDKEFLPSIKNEACQSGASASTYVCEANGGSGFTIPVTGSANLSIPAFNVNEATGVPETPMLLEVGFTDTAERTGKVVSQIKNYPGPDGTKTESTSVIVFGGRGDGLAGYSQYYFKKTPNMLLVADKSSGSWKFNFQISGGQSNVSYIALKKITDYRDERSFLNRQLILGGHKEVPLIVDKPKTLPAYEAFNVYTRDLMRPIYLHTKPMPGEINKPLAGFSAQGETQPLSLGLYANGNTASELTFEMAGELSNSAGKELGVTIQKVVLDESRVAKKGNPRFFARLADRIEDISRPMSVAPNTSQQLWIEVAVPGDAPGGLYTGNLKIKKGGSDFKTVQVRFYVVPTKLENSENYNFGSAGDPTIDVPESMGSFADASDMAKKIGYELIMLTKIDDRQITVNGGNFDFDFSIFKARLKKASDAGLIKRVVSVNTIESAIYAKMFDSNITADLGRAADDIKKVPPDYTFPDIVKSRFSNPDFINGFKQSVVALENVKNEVNPQIDLVYSLGDEICYNDFKRERYAVLAEAFKNIKDTQLPGIRLQATYSAECEADITNPSAKNSVDFKAFNNGGEGYAEKISNPDFYGGLGVYTTSIENYRMPIYNRFVHGLYTYGTGLKTIFIHAILQGANRDLFDAFDSSASNYETAAEHNAIYPTNFGKPIINMSGVGIQQGIMDEKYITTLKKLIRETEERTPTPVPSVSATASVTHTPSITPTPSPVPTVTSTVTGDFILGRCVVNDFISSTQVEDHWYREIAFNPAIELGVNDPLRAVFLAGTTKAYEIKRHDGRILKVAINFKKQSSSKNQSDQSPTIFSAGDRLAVNLLVKNEQNTAYSQDKAMFKVHFFNARTNLPLQQNSWMGGALSPFPVLSGRRSTWTGGEKVLTLPSTISNSGVKIRLSQYWGTGQYCGPAFEVLTIPTQ